MINVGDWTADELRIATRQCRDLAARCQAAGMTNVAHMWTRLADRLTDLTNARTDQR